MNIVALAGGVGGAKLADGLQHLLGNSLTVIVNTGDDFEWHGLHVAPDLDTVMYTLAGIANSQTGWGLAGDSFNSLGMFEAYGEEGWFRIGDRDLATHVLRTEMLDAGRTLSEVTASLARKLGVRAALLPMSDERVMTRVSTDEGELSFQDYFVKRKCKPRVRAVRLAGIRDARPPVGALEAIDHADAIVICPSNPFLSIEPILSVRGMRASLKRASAKCVAVSPLVGGQALKGPAAKMFHELGIEPSARAVAEMYRGLAGTIVIDKVDVGQKPAIQDQGMKVRVTDTVMTSVTERERLAREVLNWVIDPTGG